MSHGRASFKGSVGMKLFKQVEDDCRGTAVAEYGLIAAVAGVAIAVASLALGSAMTSDFGAAPPCAEQRC